MSKHNASTGDSDEQMIKTPAGKNTMPKSAASDKKVSFQFPSKNTPGKRKRTPEVENSLVKKQAISGKKNLKEFYGISKNATQKDNRSLNLWIKFLSIPVIWEAASGSAKNLRDVLPSLVLPNSDFGDSDDEQQLIKTPAGKNIKPKSTASDKKVSFLFPSKAPWKRKRTPEVENSLVKKQATPGKKNFKEFSGISKNAAQNDNKGKKSKNESNDEEEEDDYADFDMLLGGDDSNDDQEEDDEMEEEEEESKILIQTNATQKQNIKSEEKLIKKGRTEDEKSRTLIVENLPSKIALGELTSLSNDIINVHIRRRKKAVAFLVFSSEEKARENYALLQKKKKLHGKLVDFQGKEKGRAEPAESHQDAKSKDHKIPATSNLNLRRLVISNLPVDATMIEAARFFPNSFQILLNNRTNHRRAIADYHQEEDAKQDFEKAKTLEIEGKPLVISHPMKKTKKTKSKGSTDNGQRATADYHSKEDFEKAKTLEIPMKKTKKKKSKGSTDNEKAFADYRSVEDLKANFENAKSELNGEPISYPNKKKSRSKSSSRIESLEKKMKTEETEKAFKVEEDMDDD